MATSYEMFLKTIRTSSPREQEEVWKNLMLRAYPHERVSMLKQVLTFMERQDPEGLRTAIREYKSQRDARLSSASSGGISSNSSDPARNDTPAPRPAGNAQRPYVNPPWDAT
jgi:hypothetical protein